MEHNESITYCKNRKYDTSVFKKKRCQCMIKQYYTNYIGKKGKCINYKNLLFKCISNSNYSYFTNKYFTNF